MSDHDDDFEELRPLGEASRIPDQQLVHLLDAEPRQRRNASVKHGYPEHSTTDETTCRSCGSPIPASQTKCRFCLINHLDGTAADTTDTTQESTLVGIVFALVEASTFYGAVAKGAAAGNLLVADETDETIDDYRLIYDLETEPAPQLADRWPALPDASRVTSAVGEQLLTAIRRRTDWQDASAPASNHEGRPCLYDERGAAILSESRLDTVLEGADNPTWMVPAIALRESNKKWASDGQSTIVPTKGTLECHHCSSETEHWFRTQESCPDESWSGQPIWECQKCSAYRYGPDPR